MLNFKPKLKIKMDVRKNLLRGLKNLTKEQIRVQYINWGYLLVRAFRLRCLKLYRQRMSALI